MCKIPVLFVYFQVCQTCERDSDWVNMTVCDDCGCSYHIFCLIFSGLPDV